ncbi:MAG: MFS transporter [Prevotella sp.]|jgi:FHS family L-fucose permease-like MFS transporter|nr:MFS transporter [Prevotella sp.]
MSQKKNGSVIAIITCMFLYAMISFVTNLGAPAGTVWKNAEGIDGSNMLGMMGNMMNFLAYLFMGIPAGKMLTTQGYKKTAMIGIAVGFIGVLIQFLSGTGDMGHIAGLPIAWFVYLLGAFICGFSVCMLNTVVNPMLNLLGGGGNRGNQLNMIGGTLNSLAGTATPLLVGALVGQVTKETQMADINLVLYIAMAVFACAFVILSFIPIENPTEKKKDTVYERSAWAFRHCTLGIIGIFLYVGIEIGLPGTLNFYLSDPDNGAFHNLGLYTQNAAAIAGFVAASYWFLMLIGRMIGSAIGGKVSSRMMMICATSLSILFIIIAMIIPETTTINMPTFTGSSFSMAEVPTRALLIVLCGLCTSIMWPSIFNLSVEGLGKYTEQASGLFMMMVVGGGIMPLIQNALADKAGYMFSYIVPLLSLAYLFLYALIGSKNVNKDIKID